MNTTPTTGQPRRIAPLACAPAVAAIPTPPAVTEPLAEDTRSRPLRTITLLVSLLTVVLTIRYIVWRTLINNWHDWWLSVPLLAAEIFTALHILGYQYTIWPRKESELVQEDDPTRLPVFVFIPTVNEGDAVLEPTIVGAIEARRAYLAAYPHASVRIIVCNDGRVAGNSDWEGTERLASRLGVECVTRTIGGGAKAGNIEHARRLVGATGDSLIMVLDADQIARPEFLLRTVAPFADRSVGWVQSRQYYRNQENRVARWAERQAALFYDFVCPGKASVNASFICGTNVVIRAEVLDSIGGFPPESITEDFAASIRTHHNWKSVYLKDILAEGLGPMDLSAFFVQQSRWARGTIGVFLSDWKRIASPRGGGLDLRQRVQYLLSGTHYLCGVRDLVFLISAVACLVVDRSPVAHVTLGTIAGYLLPYIIATQVLLVLQAGTRGILSAMIIGYGSFPIFVVGFVEAVLRRRVGFKVTPKTSSSHSDLPAMLPHIAIALVCVAALLYAVLTRTAWTATKCIPVLWVAYALAMLLPTFRLAKWGR